MKKIINILCFVAVATFVFVSCDINKYPTFNDKDAFVAFRKTSMNIAENGSKIDIPIALASLSGITATVTCEAVDGTAKKGIDFNIIGDGSISFSSDKREDTLSIEIINRAGIYTGDLKFTVVFSTMPNGINTGDANTLTITINDLDHPLASILGDYTATGEKYKAGVQSWTMTLKKDASDDHKVWFFDLANLGSWKGDDVMYYGIVNDDLTSITIPFGQDSEYKYSNGNAVKLLGLDSKLDGFDEGSTTVSVLNGGKNLDFGSEWGFWCNIEGAGYIAITLPGITAVKK
jgi:hypothetical protein